MNSVNLVYMLSSGVLLTLLIGVQFRPMVRGDREQIILRTPLLVFSFYYFFYWVFGTFYMASDPQYLMLQPAADAIPYAMLIVTLGYLSFLCAWYIFMPGGTRMPAIVDPALSYKAAVITLYVLLWVLRLYLMNLGLYHKTAFIENLANVALPPVVNIFYQVMSTFPFLFILFSMIYLRRLYWVIILLEAINFLLTGWKSGIMMAVFFAVITAFLYRQLPEKKYFLRIRSLSLAALLLLLSYVSLFISPYVFSRELTFSENYIQEFVGNIPDFVRFVIKNEGSEASEKEYTITRLAAINPMSAVVYQAFHEDRPLLYGETWRVAALMLVPRVLARDKPERYGDDIEEQDALRHFDLPDYDTVGTIPFSGYANFGLAGSLFSMFIYGSFIALVWRAILHMAGSENHFINFNGFLVLVFFLTRTLLLEQTLIPATLFNLRNILFILLTANLLRFVYYLLFVEFLDRYRVNKVSAPESSDVINR